MKRLFVILALGSYLISPASEIPLDPTWDFRTDPLNLGIRERWYDPDHNLCGWDSMEVPDCWNTRLEYADYTGAAWYATEFIPDKIPAEHEAQLVFEGVYSDTEVYLNGERLGCHDFGFTTFGFDITRRLVPGTKNRITLRVDNSFKLGATWNWGGIRRPVRLRILPRERVDSIRITALPDLSSGSADVKIKLLLCGGDPQRVRISVSDPQGKIVTRRNVLTAGQREELVEFRLRHAQLWNFDHPNLYTVTVTDKNGRILSERFGIRKIEVDGYRLLLNGESVRLNGANWVPYDPFHGNVLPPEIYRRDIDRMKSCGCNMARLSHLALPEDVLDYLDEKGMLIFEEIPLWNRNHYVRTGHPVPMRWLSELITQRYNHPCIIGWSAGNEIGRLSDNPDIGGYLTSAFRHIRSLDSTRLAVYVTHTAAKQYDEPVLLSDLILFNQYGAHGARADEVHRRYPGKPIFYSEYGTHANSEDPNNRIVDYAALVGSMRGREHLIGASVWTFNDYRTNYRDSGTAATGNRPWGVVDVYGTIKRGYRELQQQNSPLAGFSLTDSGVKIQPRGTLDLPAFRMEGYTVRICALGTDGDTLRQIQRPLPVICPGDKPFEIGLSLETADACRLIAELLSPTGYVVHDDIRSLTPPSAPVISRVESGQEIIRVWFDRSPSAREWYVRYGTDSLSERSPMTINSYVELPKLVYGQEYRIRLYAVNDAGETPSAEEARTRTRAAEIPPVLRHLSQEGAYIQVGYACDFGDFCYEFEYGLSPERLDRRILTTVTGACRLPVVEPGAQHFLRIRKRLRYGYASDWSPVYSVKEIHP